MKSPRVGIFIQVRLDSTRLARKALLPLPGGNLIRHAMRAMRLVPADEYALLTDEASASALGPHAEDEGFRVFVGPPEDVLARYAMAARSLDVQRVVRATGDNPLVSPFLAREILGLHGRLSADLSHFLKIPWGSGIEVVESGALFTAERMAVAPDEREHMTTWIYRHPEGMRILEPEGPEGFTMAEARVTVDTPQDYEQVNRIFEDLYRGTPLETDRIIEWFRRKH